MSFFTEVIATEGGAANVSSTRHKFKGRNRAAIRNAKSALERLMAIDQRIAAAAGADADTATYILNTSSLRTKANAVLTRLADALAL